MPGASVAKSLRASRGADAAWSSRAALTIGSITLVTMLPATMLVAPLKELISVRYAAGSFWTHSFMSVNMLGAIVAAPLIAVLSDRAGQRRLIAASALAIDAACLISMSLTSSLASVLVIRFMEGAAHILALTTLLAIAASRAPMRYRGRMMGTVGACMMFGTACGTRLGGVVWTYFPDLTFVIAGLVSVVAALCVCGFLSEPANSGAYRPRMQDALRTARRNPWLMVPFVYAFIDRLCVGVVISTFVLFLGDVHAMQPDGKSRLLLLFLLPFALLVYPAGRLVDRIGRVWPIALGSMAFGVVFATYGVLSTEQLAIAMVVSGVLSAIMFAPNLAMCADLSPAEHRGAVYAGFNAAGSLGFVVGPLLAGAAFNVLSAHWPVETAYRWTFMGAGAAEILCAGLTLPLLLRLRRRGRIR